MKVNQNRTSNEELTVMTYFIVNEGHRLQRKPKLQFSIGRAFRNVADLRAWINEPSKDKTNNGFLYTQREVKIP